MSLESLLGLPLEDALATLPNEALVCRTEPPFFARGYSPHWGQNRVVRVRRLDGGRVELLVARELIGETRMQSETGKESGKG